MNESASAEAVDRKFRSETILRTEGVPILAALPVIETTAEALKRSKEEIALRALCLLLVAARGEGLEDEIVERVLKSYELRPHLTPKNSPSCSTIPLAARPGSIHLQVRSHLDSALGVGLRGPIRQTSSALRRGIRGRDDYRKDSPSVHRGLRTSPDRRHP